MIIKNISGRTLTLAGVTLHGYEARDIDNTTADAFLSAYAGLGIVELGDHVEAPVVPVIPSAPVETEEVETVLPETTVEVIPEAPSEEPQSEEVPTKGQKKSKKK